MVILYCDIEYASKEKVEATLWTAHVLLNSAYRKVKEKYEKQQRMVTKRTIEKLYDAFIKTSQLFYKAHLQRLCACYPNLPELQRLVAGGAVDKFEGLGDTARVDAVAPAVKNQVLTSAYLTLNYLGDLWRYRTQLHRLERRKYDAALAYYRLATDLDPRSGYASHQMGVIFLEQERHFDIVYHFYRSLAAEEPHPNAAKNLESEFNRVLKSSASPRGHGPHHALQDWIVRLHAHFYLGKAFPQHAELEDEVLHRFGLAVKAHDFGHGLLKIALMNICAYQVAKDRITGKFSSSCDQQLCRRQHIDSCAAEWTAERSQTCQFTLRLNIRTINVILHQLEPELSDVVNQMQSASNGTSETSSNKDDSIFNALVNDALPLLRIYMTWLCMYRLDIVQYKSHLQPYVGQMYKSLGEVLSSLFEMLRHSPRREPVPYLFPEDMEAFGLKALNGRAIPHACLLGIDSMTRTPKSRPDGAGSQDSRPDDVSFTRVLDITTCGFVLADDQEFPLAIAERLTHDGHRVVKATYLPEGKPAPPTVTARKVATNRTSPATATVEGSAMLGVRSSPTVATTELAPRAVSARGSNLADVANGFAEALTLQGGQQGSLSADQTVSAYPPRLAEEANYAVDHDSRMNDLVNGLVEPSESDATEAVVDHSDTSYGMHTATARDVFGSALPSTGPGLASKQIGLPSLSWAWGSVAESAPHQRGVSSGSSRDAWPVSNRNSAGAVPQQGTANNNNPFGSIGGSSDYQTATGSTSSNAQGVWGHARQNSRGIEGASTATGLAGQPSNGYGPSTTNSPWNQSSSKFSSIQDILGAQLGALVPGPTGTRPVASPPAQVSPAIPSPFGSTNFSGATSSLPPVYSPWGVPTRAATGSTKPGPIGPPPGLKTGSRPKSIGNGVGSSSWRQGNSSSIYQGVASDCQPSSRPDSGPSTPGLSAAATDGLAQQPAQKRDGAYEAMLRKLQKPKS